MTEYEIASAVLNRVTSHEGVTQSALTQRQVRDEADTVRLKIVQQMDKQRGLIPEAYYQHLEKVKTTPVTSGVFKGFTYIAVPRIHINLKGKPQVQYVGPVEEREPNRVVIGNHHIYVKSERFTNKYPMAFYDQDKIYFSEGYKAVTLKALFEDPSDLADFTQYDWKVTDYPAPLGDINTILDTLVRKYVPEVYRIPPQPNTQTDSPQVQQNAAQNKQAASAG